MLGNGIPEEHRRTEASQIDQALGSFKERPKTQRRKAADRKKSVAAPANIIKEIPEKTQDEKLKRLADN